MVLHLVLLNWITLKFCYNYYLNASVSILINVLDGMFTRLAWTQTAADWICEHHYSAIGLM